MIIEYYYGYVLLHNVFAFCLAPGHVRSRIRSTSMLIRIQEVCTIR